MTNEQWEQISSRVRAVLNYGIAQKEWLQSSKMARLIASVPFLAGCAKPTETSFCHLTIYLLSLDESARDLFFHKPEDDKDIYSRLIPISNYAGGDRNIIQCCTDLMVLCMISNYDKNVETDRAIGKYNPVNEAGWDYQTLSQKLIQSINKTITPEISRIYTIEEALKGYWQN